VIPQASCNPERKPIAAWIVPILEWASEHGWTGTVTCGYRTYSQQASLNASGMFSAPAGKSNSIPSTSPQPATDHGPTPGRSGAMPGGSATHPARDTAVILIALAEDTERLVPYWNTTSRLRSA
jgi:hypothetical protein